MTNGTPNRFCHRGPSANALLTVTLPVPLKFAGALLLPDNQIKLTLTADPGTSITILRSDDLVNWQPLTNISSSSGMIEFVDAIAAAPAQRFYRAQLTP